ncbi:putative GP52-bacteriophage PHIC31 [Streptomyces ambofaciens ATCC 23877]|uniref:Putative GP52-bacteriophage PHIC31 n=1 Tax=Streptomyces ambofaciens (strain ATCC 23877 / 3486 / DSM 40053 / JCM 4204 / NBRC 12836 / NRRL B-2516) TaxID=278992 RepID=A0A0K2B253_STRA7|nr:hypothetical protein [Streptomyces ambofaciens]AKZ59167.1 putative GP52-bacteriophage PHIC31 [Streptomyces ambofaciens ATCC 23877]WNA15360.1 deoxynucleoside monophosphate kinase [Streptomyces phage Samy]
MNIGIIGRARVGKDTAGKWLVDNRGYRRVAFADALKEAALKVDPIIGCFADEDTHAATTVRLGEIVRTLGWELAKETPEVRRFLQELGAAVRAIDEDFWLRAAMKTVMEANDGGVPVVITDVRYPNEAASLKRAGFRLVYMERPGVPRMDHASENSLTPADADDYIHNAGDVDELHRMVEALWDDVYRVESARHVNRL